MALIYVLYGIILYALYYTAYYIKSKKIIWHCGCVVILLLQLHPPVPIMYLVAV